MGKMDRLRTTKEADATERGCEGQGGGGREEASVVPHHQKHTRGGKLNRTGRLRFGASGTFKLKIQT